MNPELRHAADHMKELGLASLAHALRTSLYHDPWASDAWPSFSVLNAAHAAEILLKARIAQEHPLLIFEEFPKAPADPTALLDFKSLFERGKTVQYHELPARLWATTGIRLADQGRFLEFGRMRNSIQHFATPGGVDLSQATLEFVFGVIDPFIQQCWGLFAVDYNEEMDHYEHIFSFLIGREVRFLVSPASAAYVAAELSTSKVRGAYKRYLEEQITRLKVKPAEVP